MALALRASNLPNPLVELHVDGHPVHAVSAYHSLKPQFPSADGASFPRMHPDTHVHVHL